MNASATFAPPVQICALTPPTNPSGVHPATTARSIHRARDFGVGYGRSSGYASPRRYVIPARASLFRFS